MRIILTGEDLALLKEAYKYRDVVYIDEGLGLHIIEPSFIYRVIDPIASKDYRSFQNTIISIMTRYCNNCLMDKKEIEKLYDNFLNKRSTRVKGKVFESEKIEDRIIYYKNGSSFIEYMIQIQESIRRYNMVDAVLLEAK